MYLLSADRQSINQLTHGHGRHIHNRKLAGFYLLRTLDLREDQRHDQVADYLFCCDSTWGGISGRNRGYEIRLCKVLGNRTETR